jgi:hypothetical protein
VPAEHVETVTTTLVPEAVKLSSSRTRAGEPTGTSLPSSFTGFPL